MRQVPHGPRGLRPTGARSLRRLDDETPGLGMQFDLVGKLRLIQENFRNADAA
jgi:hypothetical protein